MLKTARQNTVFGAAGVVANALPGYMQILPMDAHIRIAATTTVAAALATMDVYIGGEHVVQGLLIPLERAAGRGVVIPDDYMVDEAGPAGASLVMTLTAGAICTINWQCELMPM